MIEIKKNAEENVLNNIPNQPNTIEAQTPAKVSVQVKSSNSVDLLGKVFGDYVVVGLNGRDSSGHKLWNCLCPICGDSFSTTSYELLKGRKNTTCKKCEAVRKKKFEEEVELTKVSNEPTLMNYLQGYLDGVESEDELEECYDEECDCEDYDDCCGDCDGDCDSCDFFEAEEEVKEEDKNKEFDENTVFCSYASGTYTEEKYCHLAPGVFVRDLKADLLSMPVYYNIAHCLPADLSVYGNTAKRIDEYYDLVDRILTNVEEGETFFVGEVIALDNVFTLIVNPKARTHPTLNDMRKCINALALYCAQSGVMHLAMPRIGCGHNKLNWDEVKHMICEEFAKAYQTNCGLNTFKPIKITFCYQ